MTARPKALLLLVIILVALSAWIFYPAQIPEDTPDAASRSEEYVFISSSCWFTLPEDRPIRCGHLHTPASSGAFVLPVAIIADISAQRRDDPVMYLQGGPGVSAWLDDDGMDYWMAFLDRAQLGRDLVLMDVRGTGGSLPALRCEAFDRLSVNILREDTTIIDEYRRGAEVLALCFAQASGFSPKYYGTRQAAEDVRGLITSLSEYREWNLLGVSYGSRLAMVAAYEFEPVKTLVLDSVYPPETGNLEDWPALLDQSIRRFSAWCDSAANCNSHPETPMLSRITGMLEQLRDKPVFLRVDRWNGDWAVTVLLNDHRFLAFVFSSLYSSYQWRNIDEVISLLSAPHVGTGVLLRVSGILQSFINTSLSEDFSPLGFIAVDCADQSSRSEAHYQQMSERYPLFSAYTRGLWPHQSCEALGFDRSAALDASIRPEQPALLLSGDLDPITPHEWAEALHGRWQGSQMLLMPETGHAVIGEHTCVLQQLAGFMDSPENPVTACVDEAAE